MKNGQVLYLDEAAKSHCSQVQFIALHNMNVADYLQLALFINVLVLCRVLVMQHPTEINKTVNTTFIATQLPSILIIVW